MFSLSRLVGIRFAATLAAAGRRSASIPARLIDQKQTPARVVLIRKNLFCTMADRVVTYEDVVSYKDDPKVLIVDVREPKELQETGVITSSINIPLGDLEATLKNPPTDFKSKYGRDFPEKDMQLVFSCKMGGRATKAMNAALALGFENSKVYKGSWDDWASKQ